MSILSWNFLIQFVNNKWTEIIWMKNKVIHFLLYLLVSDKLYIYISFTRLRTKGEGRIFDVFVSCDINRTQYLDWIFQ